MAWPTRPLLRVKSFIFGFVIIINHNYKMLLEGLGGSLEESGSDYDSDDDFDRVQRDDLGIYLLYFRECNICTYN